VADYLEELYRQHAASIWRYVRTRVPAYDEARDVTSEVFLRAIRSHHRFDPSRGSEGAWLAGIARHTVVDWWRRQGREVPQGDIDPDRRLASSAEGPEDHAVRTDAANAVLRRLDVLTDREREAVAMRFAAGLRAAEVGSVLGVSEAAAKMLIHRAVTKLRAVMGDE
jgi:RNA polymerase sigma factor (sigma-70 family)